MLKKNAATDNAKKALVNFTYELDNLLLKTEKVIENISNINKDTEDYLLETMKEIKMSYSTNNLSKISETLLDEVKYISKVLSIENIKSQLKASESTSKKGNSGGGVVIDVTEE